MKPQLSIHRTLLVASVSAAALVAAVPALGQTLPTGGSVAAGAASLQTAGGVLTVTQTTARADLNWQTFDIGAGGKVVFAQPSSSAVAVNRVLSGGPSAVLGALEANGRVFLLNPNGVIFGKGAQVNVGGLVAAAGELTGDPEGRFQLTAAPGGTVSNAGQIIAGGGVLLAGDRVVNTATGSIRGAGVTLAAGRQASVALDTDGLVRLRIDQAALDAAVANQGVIVAPGGQVLLTAQGVAAAVGVGPGGRISTEGQGGSITLDAGPDGKVVADGMLSTTSATGKGGQITVLGRDLSVGGDARLDASGRHGGGTILVGGGAYGEGQPYNAQSVRVTEGAQLSADAGLLGDGGTIVIWSDDRADITGRFSARGGQDGGDGGFVETSARQDLRIGESTTVNALAPRGKAGDWLLDPTTITIAASGAGTLADAAGGASGAVTVSTGTINAATANVILSASTAITQNAGANISIAAPGVGITFQGAAAGTAPSSGTFLAGTLQTNNGAITINGPVTLNANSALNAGTSAISITGTVDSSGSGPASLTLSGSGAASANFGAAIGSIRPLSSFTSPIATGLTGSLTVTGGILLGAVTLNSDLTINKGASTLSITGAIDSASGQNYALSLTGAGIASLSGSVGATNKLKSFDTTGVTLRMTGASASVNTHNGAITLGGLVQISGSTAFNSGTGAVTFNSGVNSTVSNSNSLIVNVDPGNTGPVVFAAGAGSFIGFNQIQIGGSSSPGAVSLAGSFRAAGVFSARGPVTLTGATTVSSPAITFLGAIDGGHSLSLSSTGGGAISLGGDIGAVTPLASLSLPIAGNYAFSGAVITTGDQTYTGGGRLQLDGGAALVSSNGSLNIFSSLASAGTQNVQLVAGYSGYSVASRTFGAATPGASGSSIFFSGFTSTNSTGLAATARNTIQVLSDLGSAGNPLGMMSFSSSTLNLGSGDAPISLYGSRGLLATGAVTAVGGSTWSLSGWNPEKPSALSVELGGDLTITSGNLAITAPHDMQLRGVSSSTPGGASLTVSGGGGQTPTFSSTGIGQGGQTLSSVSVNTPVSLGSVATTGDQTYAMGGSFSGTYSSSAAVSVTADRSAGRFISLSGDTSFSGGNINLSGTVISPTVAHNLSLSAPGLTVTQAIFGDRNLGAIGNLTLSSTGGVNLGGNAHAIAGTFTADVNGALTFRNTRGFSLGAISTRVGATRISTDTGDIVVTGAVTPSGDLMLIAGETGRRVLNGADDGLGDIRISGGSVTLAGGARGLLYTGSLSNSTGLGGVVPVGRSRYYIDTVNGYSDATALPAGSGLFALFREQARARLLATLSDGVTTYDGKSHAGAFQVTGLSMGDTTTTPAVTSIKDMSGATVSGVTGAGAYTFLADASALSDLRALGYAVNDQAVFTLNRAPLTLTYTANAATSVYGQPLAAVSGAVTGSGFVNDETLAVLGGAAAWSTAATAGSGTGSYAVTGGGLTSGNYLITAQQAAGNSSAYTLTRALLTITGATTSQRYNGATQINGFSVTSGQLFYADRIDSLTGLATGRNVGTYTDNLSAATGSGLGNYDITYVNGGLTITRAELTVASSTDPRTYSGLAQTNTFTVTGLLGGDTVSSVSGLATGTNAGTYAESLSGATGSGVGNYDITYISSGLTIAPAPLTLTYTANAATSIYGQPLAAVSGTVNGSGFVNDETLKILGGTPTWTTTASASAGSYAITGGGLTSSNYAITAIQAEANATAYSLTRAPLTLTYTANAATSVYGQPLAAVSGAVTGSGFVNDETLAVLGGAAAWSTTATAGSATGSYAVTGGGLTSGNYLITAQQAAGNSSAYTLTRASLTITGATASQRYNGATQINGFRVISGQLFYADRIDSLTGLATGTNVGTYNDSLSAAAGVGLSNYDITYVNGGLTITRAPLTVASSTNPRTYSGLAQTNTFTVSGLFGGDTVSGVSGLATGTNAGTYAESLSGATGSGLGNYEITYISSGLTIAPAALTLTYTANTATSIYGQPLAAMSGSVGGAGFVNGETLGVLNGSATWTTAASAGASAGSYAITGGGLTSSNYAITALQAAINNLAYAVTRANLTIVGGAGARVYNGQTQTNSFSAIGLVGSDQIDGVTGLASGMNVGSYSDNLTGAFGAGLHNYNITYVNGSLRISPAALRVEGGVTTRTYSGAVQTNPFTVTGLMGNDTVTSVAGLASGVNAGAYADNLSGAMGSGLQNYTVAYANGRLTIDPASLVLTYTASNAASTYGDPLAALSGTVAGSGFVGGETLAVLTGAPTWTTAAVVRSSVGGYAIIGGGLSASNYNVEVRQAPGNATAYAVTARPIAGVTGISVSDKRFDGTLTATADTRNASLSGLLPGDAVQLASVTAAFTSMGPGLAIPVTITLNGLTGAAARNYTLVPTTVTASAAITTQQIPTPAPLYTASLGVNVATPPPPTNPSPPPPPPPNDPLAATPAETLAPAGNGGGSTDAKSVTCSQVGDQSVCKQDDPTGRIRADRP